MYEPFPGNYVWNLSVNICIGMGGAIGEIDQANDRVRELAKQGDDTGTEAFFSSWIAMADGVIGLADEAAAAGHFLSAAEKYCSRHRLLHHGRAYAEPPLCTAEASLSNHVANHGARDCMRFFQLRTG